MYHFLPTALATAKLLSFVTAQYFPPTPEGITLLKSKFHENVSISYKEVSSPASCFSITDGPLDIHLRNYPGVRSYSGCVHLPADPASFRNYEINTFFWFFESRKDSSTAPLAIWLNGGPGASSTASALGENGPCIVGLDSNSTTLNYWSWNNEVNMLYIDQPVKVGFSYDTLANGTFNALSTSLLPVVADFAISGVPEQNETLFVGTFPSLTSNNTANSTGNAAPAVWSVLQTWLEEYVLYIS